MRNLADRSRDTFGMQSVQVFIAFGPTSDAARSADTGPEARSAQGWRDYGAPRWFHRGAYRCLAMRLGRAVASSLPYSLVM